jgi:RNA polymerase sigma factor for flagellar operon FliA
MRAAYAQVDQQELLRTYMPLVRRIAAHIASRLPHDVVVDDLAQEGALGLLDAIGRHQPQPNENFEAYVSMRVRGAIYDACRRNDLLARQHRDRLDAVQAVIRRMEHELGRVPTQTECAAELKLSLQEYQQWLDQSVGLLPLDDVPEEWLPDDPQADPFDHLALQQMRQLLARTLEKLPEKQQMVMALHYQQDLSFAEIAEVLKLTRGRISQLHTQAMLTVRALLGPDPKSGS